MQRKAWGIVLLPNRQSVKLEKKHQVLFGYSKDKGKEQKGLIEAGRGK